MEFPMEASTKSTDVHVACPALMTWSKSSSAQGTDTGTAKPYLGGNKAVKELRWWRNVWFDMVNMVLVWF